MKKKILSIISIVLAVVMMLPVMVWADGESPSGDTSSEPEISSITILANGKEVPFDDDMSVVKLYNKGENSRVQLSIKENVPVTWQASGSNVVSVSSDGTVTALSDGTATIYAYYNNKGNSVSANVNIDVAKRNLESIAVADSSKVKVSYNEGDTFDKSGLRINATYNDGLTVGVDNFTVSPSGKLRPEDKSVTISYTEDDVTSKTTISGITVSPVTVSDFTIESPAYNMSYKAGDIIKASDIEIKVTESNGDVFYLKGDSEGVSYSPTGALKTTDTKLTVTYNGTSKDVKITVADSKKPVSLKITETTSAKTSYYVGEKFDLSGYKCVVTYSDGTTTELSSTQKSSIKFDAFTSTGTKTVKVEFTSNSTTVSDTVSVKVAEKLTFYGLIDEDDKDEDDAYVLSSKINIKVGDKLNKDVDWTDVFDEVYLEYKDSNGKRRTERIRKDSDLESVLPGAKLLLGVYSKRNDYDKYALDEIKTSSFNSNGELELILYVEYAGQKYTASNEAIVVTVTAEGSGVVVNLYRSSSSSVYDSVAFDDIEEAFDALEDDKYDDFSSTVRSSDYFVIKLYEDQDLGRSFNFEPETDNNITVDLNGFELTLPSDFINWNRDNEDMVLTVTNNNNKKDGKLTYRDLNVSSITVEKSDKLEFKKDVIPGFYTIKAETGSHGTVEVRLDGSKVSDPSKAFSAPKDGKLIFTITPDKGYEISTVKANSSSVTSSSDYSVSTGTGVATYEVKVAKDLTLSVTFKEASKTSDSSKDDSGSKGASTDNWSNPFTDITSRDAYYDSVAFVCANGIFNGTSSNKFSPTMSMTRAMFVTAVGRLAEKSQGIDIKNNSAYQTSSFKDVSKTDAEISYAIPYIEWASRNGITQGVGDGKFDPKTPITHAQMYTFMYRYAMFVEKLNPSVSNIRITVSDKNDIPTWAEDAVKFATQSSLIISSGGRITPNDNALRWELATIIGGFAKKVLGW